MGSDGAHVGELRDAGDVVGEDGPSLRVDLDLGDTAKSCSLEAEVCSSDSREEADEGLGTDQIAPLFTSSTEVTMNFWT